MFTEVSGKVISLTPARAAELLSNGAPNRAVRSAKVDEYARDMLAGKWELNGEPIIVDNSGRLVQGQHRCLAVIQSQTTIQTMFVEGVEPQAIHTMDRNIRRTLGDVLYMNMEGIAPSTARVLAATLQHLARWKATGSFQSSMQGNTQLTTSEGLQMIRSLPEGIVESCRISSNIAPSLNVPVALMSALHFVFNGIDESDCAFFFDALSKGVGLDAHDPIWVLRERLISVPKRRGKLDQQEKSVLIIKGWNAYRRGEKVNRLTWSPGREKYPQPV